VTTTMPPHVITDPGIYDGIPDHVYHGDPVPGGSLSSTGARRLLPPSCPALYRWERDNPAGPKPHFDLGHAAHRLVLGTGPDLVRIDADEWRTKAVKEEVAAVRDRGGVPLKPADHDTVHAMAAAIRRHRLAATLLDPTTGQAEQTAAWVDPDTGIWCRARYDWLRTNAGPRPLIVDYKTTTSADPEAIRRTVAQYGYHQQHAHYLDGAIELGVPDVDFLFVFQAKTPPYLVTVVSLDDHAVDIGRQLNRRAAAIYADCTTTGHWPGHAPNTEMAVISLPTYATRESEITYV
jgi:hypothetical protein